MTISPDQIEHLLDIPDRAQRLRALRTVINVDDPNERADVAPELKDRVIRDLNTDYRRAMRSAELALDLGELTEDEQMIALGLRLVAQSHLIGLGDHNVAREFYDRAISIYEAIGDELGRAETALTHIWALATEGKYEAAVREGNWAFGIFERLGDARSLGTLMHNLAYIHHREGRMQQSFELIERAHNFYAKLGPEAEALKTSNVIDKAGMLHDLGRYSEAIRFLEAALEIAERMGNSVLVARARQSLGYTYQVLGWYNRALKLLELARAGWVEDNREQELQWVDFLIGTCLLHMGHFKEAIPIFERVRVYYREHGALYETGRMFLNQARAEIGLGEFERALVSLEAGKDIFLQTGNRHEAARADLFAATLHHRTGNWQESIALCLSSRAVFTEEALQLDAAAALLQAGRSSLALGDLESAGIYAREAQTYAHQHGLAPLAYQVYYLLGRIARAENALDQATENFRLGVDELEKLQNRMMVEYRSDFLVDDQKIGLYESAISLSLERNRPLESLNFVERAKSRALLDILANRIGLEIMVRNPEDAPLVEEFNRLMRERNALARNLERTWEWPEEAPDMNYETEKIREIEGQIESLRSRLLVRHADYSNQLNAFAYTDAARNLAKLDNKTIILDFFFLDNRPVVFLVENTAGQLHVEAHHLAGEINTLRNLFNSLLMNFSAAAYGKAVHVPELMLQARTLLKHFYDMLLAPISGRLANFEHLVIAPYGLLHYLPFHAFFDGDRYLVEKYKVSFLPSAGFWREEGPRDDDSGDTLIVGYSYDGRLPNAVDEARSVASLWDSEPLLEEAATAKAILPVLAGCRLFHCASHAVFRPDSPLFSGIALPDGWLTTLEVFNLKLNASLVTLSACGTGRSAIGGGDELLGFIRAFLAAGASSLLLSQWEVEDRSTSLLMQAFYRKLQTGSTKVEALRNAQRAFINGEIAQGGETYRHPYYWAPFYLVGHSGNL